MTRREDKGPGGTLTNPRARQQDVALEDTAIGGSASGPPLDDTLAARSTPPARPSDASLDDTMAAGSTPPARPSDASLDDTRAAGSQSATPPPVIRGSAVPTAEPRRGEALDHFLVLDRIGAGGMGVVLAAYDPDLDRKVAIKLLEPTRSSHTADAQVRLLREAQAMARLSHPNVVTVHEVGVIGDRVFIAMEYVDGGTLKRRDGDEPQTWRQILDRYLAAGRGLAAAHDAGLVHRDFKPDNVLIGRDGRVRVTDFGLVDVRDAKSPGPATDVAMTGPTASMRLGPDLTATGSIMGTPAYMAPEQHAGAQVDARADQYAFCVSLFEALHGQRPFAGDTYEQLVEKVNAGEITVAPRPDVPAWLRRVVVRGLATRPADRYGSMHELLAELSYERRARRRTSAFVAAGFVATIGIGGGAVWFARGEPVAAAPEPCGGAAELVAGVWDDGVRATVRTAFERTKLGYAGEAFERSATRLDTFTAGWIDQRTEACRATRVRGDQSEALLDRRMFCLDGELANVRALTKLLARADTDLVRRSVELTGSLPDLAACADTEALNAAFPPPEPAKKAAAGPLKDRIEQILALVSIGRYAEAKPLFPALLEDVRALDYPPFLAMVLLSRGNLERMTGQLDAARATLLEAARVAAVAKLDATVASAYGLIYHIVDVLQNKPDEARAMRPFVEVAAARSAGSNIIAMMHELAGGKAHRAAKFDEAIAEYREALRLFSEAEPNKIAGARFNIGTALRDQGKLDAALAELERGEQLAIERLGPNSPMTAKLASAIGATLFLKGDVAGAAPRLERAIAAQEGAFGRNHPDVGDSWTILGLVRERQGKLEDAIAAFERSRAAYVGAGGPDHPSIPFPLANLGNLYNNIGDHARARDSLREARRLWLAQLGPKHPNIGELESGIAMAEAALGNLDEAQRLYTSALAIVEASKGPKTYDYAVVLSNRAIAYRLAGDHARARSEHTRALQIVTELQGASAATTLEFRLRQGQILASAGDPAAARRELEAILEPVKATGNDKQIAAVEFELAKLLGETEPERARDLARSAEGRYVRLGAPGKIGLAEIRAWLAAKPQRGSTSIP